MKNQMEHYQVRYELVNEIFFPSIILPPPYTPADPIMSSVYTPQALTPYNPAQAPNSSPSGEQGIQRAVKKEGYLRAE